MIAVLRKRHRRMVLVLGAITLVLFAAALLLRPELPLMDPVHRAGGQHDHDS